MSIQMRGTNPQPSEDYYGPYSDPAITQLEPPVQVSTAVDPKPVRNDLGRTKFYDVEGTDQDPGNQGAVAPPHSPNRMAIEVVDGHPRPRDYYRNNGMIGQDFFKN